VFSPVFKSDIFRKEDGHKTESGPQANHEELLKPEQGGCVAESCSVSRRSKVMTRSESQL
jgi:hypothetical protein